MRNGGHLLIQSLIALSATTVLGVRADAARYRETGVEDFGLFQRIATACLRNATSLLPINWIPCSVVRDPGSEPLVIVQVFVCFCHCRGLKA